VPKKLFSYTTLIPEVEGQMSAAHHQTCPATNELFNIVLSLGQTTSIKVISISPNGEGTLYGEVKKRLHDGSSITAPYIHSFPLTKNYVVIPEYPLYLGGKGLPFIIEGNIEAAFRWDEKAKTYFHIISREKKQHVATIEADPAFSFHMGNAWETEDGIEFDCCVFPDGDIVKQLYSFANPVRKSQAKAQATKDANLTSQKINGIRNPPIRQPSFGKLRRYTISHEDIARGAGVASYRDITTNVEFPRFNARYTSQPSRYVWGCALEPATVEKNETYDIVKVATDTGEITRYHRPGYACSEPIFVPKPGANEEDDGVIVALANEYSEEEEMIDRSYVVVLDGKTLEELGKAEIGNFTPVTFHGSFVDKDFDNVSIN
jgi:torulene dioxygenase